jgi:hypothetical protein
VGFDDILDLFIPGNALDGLKEHDDDERGNHEVFSLGTGSSARLNEPKLKSSGLAFVRS